MKLSFATVEMNFIHAKLIFFSAKLSCTLAIFNFVQAELTFISAKFRWKRYSTKDVMVCCVVPAGTLVCAAGAHCGRDCPVHGLLLGEGRGCKWWRQQQDLHLGHRERGTVSVGPQRRSVSRGQQVAWTPHRATGAIIIIIIIFTYNGE